MWSVHHIGPCAFSQFDLPLFKFVHLNLQMLHIQILMRFKRAGEIFPFATVFTYLLKSSKILL